MKKIISLILATALTVSMTGCGQSDANGSSSGGSSTEGTKGAYVEAEVTMPEEYSGKGKLVTDPDGTVSLLDRYYGTINRAADGNLSWEAETVEKVKESALEGCEMTSFTESPEYGVFASYINWLDSTDEKPYLEKYYYKDATGNEAEFELGLKDYHCSLAEAKFESDGKVLVLTNEGSLFRIDPVAQSAEEVSLSDSGTLYALVNAGEDTAVIDESHVYFLGAGSTEAEASDTVLNDHLAGIKYPDSAVVALDAEGKIYVASQDGIFSHSKGGNLMEQIVDGGQTSLGNPSEMPLSMAVLSDGTILVLFVSGTMYSYTYDPDQPSVPENVLTVYSLYDNKTARQAASEFRKDNPNVAVKFETGISGTDGTTETDAIQNLNTRLLAGEGPDVILLDGMPLDSYIERGMLLDLTDTIAEMEQDTAFYDNILKAYQTDDGLYAVPLRFALPLIEGEADKIDGVTDLKSLTELTEETAGLDTTEESVLGAYDPEELLERLYPLYADSWYTEDGSADREAIEEFLEYAKRIYMADQENVDAEERELYNEGSNTMAANDPDTGVIYTKQIDNGVSQLYNQLAKRQEMVVGNFSGMSAIKNLISSTKLMGDVEYQNYSDGEKTYFVPIGIAAISASSGRTEDAAAYLKTLLGTSVQSRDLEDGFPVNKDAFASYSTNPDPDSYECAGLDDRDGVEVVIDLSWPTAAELDVLEQMIEAANTPAVSDNTLKDEIITVGVNALREEKGIEESAGEIAQKISIRAQE